MPDLRKSIGETLDQPGGWSAHDVLRRGYSEFGPGMRRADRMIAAISDRVAAALVSDEAGLGLALKEALDERDRLTRERDEARAEITRLTASSIMHDQTSVPCSDEVSAAWWATIRYYEDLPSVAERERDEARAVLRELEWCGGYGRVGGCPICGATKSEGHSRHCHLPAALPDLPAEKDAP